MPEQPLADILATPRHDILKGFVLSPFSIEMFEMAEQEFSRKHLAVTASAAENVTDRIAQMMLQIANNDVANRRFAFDTPGYRVCAFTNSNLPFMLWLSLSVKHPQLSQAEASKLLTSENEGAIRKAIFELQGYKPRKTEEDDSKKSKPGTESSSSETSSPS